jgi:hypothetical protein
MNRNVIVTANEAGQVVNVSKNNPDYGYIRVEQMKPTFDSNGWARVRKVSSLIPGNVEDLKAFGWTAGMHLPGKIVTIESLEAFNLNDPEKDYKIAGDTGIVCCQDGQPIYRKSFYTEDTTRMDVSIEHNNTEEIKAAYAALQEESVEDETNL